MAAAPHQARRAQAGRRRRLDRRCGMPSSRCRPGSRRFSAARSTTPRHMAASLLHRDAVLGRGQLPDDLGAGPGAAPLQRLRPARRGLHVDRRPAASGRWDVRASMSQSDVSAWVIAGIVHVADRDEPRLRLRRVVQHAAVPERRSRARSRWRPSPTTRATSARSTAATAGRCRRPSRSNTAPATRTTTTCGAARC